MHSKRLLQRTPYQEILRLRIQQACELLRITDLPIGRIAEEVGFEEIRTFNNAFKKQTDEVPRTWRKAMKPEIERGG
jgi:AraC-like DNA-binding protein